MLMILDEVLLEAPCGLTTVSNPIPGSIRKAITTSELTIITEPAE